MKPIDDVFTHADIVDIRPEKVFMDLIIFSSKKRSSISGNSA